MLFLSLLSVTVPVDRGSVKHFEMPINQRHSLEAASWNLLLELKQVGHICLLLFYLPRWSESGAVSVTGGFIGKVWERGI